MIICIKTCKKYTFETQNEEKTQKKASKQKSKWISDKNKWYENC